jgi:hypothetical protein
MVLYVICEAHQNYTLRAQPSLSGAVVWFCCSSSVGEQTDLTLKLRAQKPVEFGRWPCSDGLETRTIKLRLRPCAPDCFLICFLSRTELVTSPSDAKQPATG